MEVEAGKSYRVQLLFQEKGWQRGFDVLAEGILIAENVAPYAIQDGTCNAGSCQVGNIGLAFGSQMTLDCPGPPGAFKQP